MNYKEIKEEKKRDGCVFLRLFVRFPENVGNNMLDGYLRTKAENFYKYISETVLYEKEKAFVSYTEGGGRRSLFPITDYKLDITVTDAFKSLISIKTLVFFAENNNVLNYKIFYEVFDTKKGMLCSEKALLKKRSRKKHDGFYLKDGRVILYSASKDEKFPIRLSELSKKPIPVAVLNVEKGYI